MANNYPEYLDTLQEISDKTQKIQARVNELFKRSEKITNKSELRQIVRVINFLMNHCKELEQQYDDIKTLGMFASLKNALMDDDIHLKHVAKYAKSYYKYMDRAPDISILD